MSPTGRAAPAARRGGLSWVDGVAFLVGVVVGTGIFGFPPLVAQQTDSALLYMALWGAGGLVMLAGALCYAELGAAYPDAGGEYHFLSRAWGHRVGLLFAWARGSVIQTGSICAVAFIYGDHAQYLLPLGAQGAAWHAALAVVLLTALNLIGTRQSTGFQRTLSGLTVLALAGLILAALLLTEPPAARPGGLVDHPSGAGMLGLGMVFVLLTYGGWNEAAYLTGELREPRRNLLRVLLVGCGVVTLLYLMANLAYLQVFGLERLRELETVGTELMRTVMGPRGAVLLGLLICVTALGTINASILTGARVYYALGRDLPRLRPLGAWSERRDTPVRALLLQGAICLLLVGLGAWSGDGLQAMAAYTAPVFWLFMALVAGALFVLRRRRPGDERPFRVPFYPWTPLVFLASCLGLFWSSTLYAGLGALLGLLVLAAGLPLLALQPGPGR